jgi:ADP-ribose pyrophosphatase YjhB (NUDIX family)
VRNAELAAILDGREPACGHDGEWARPIRFEAYLGDDEMPDELVSSIRVLVLVEDDIVVCTNVDGFAHCWPGGRREPNETYAETACREVREETGWMLDPDSLERIGFIVIHNRGEPLPPYPHPDVVQLVYVGRAHERAAEDWTDTEGYEISSTLLPLATAHEHAIEDACLPFLELLRARA